MGMFAVVKTQKSPVMVRIEPPIVIKTATVLSCAYEDPTLNIYSLLDMTGLECVGGHRNCFRIKTINS